MSHLFVIIDPLNQKRWRTRLVISGDKLPYYDDAGSPAANLIKTKVLLNSVISYAHHGARFMILDIKDYFLASPTPTPSYIKNLQDTYLQISW